MTLNEYQERAMETCMASSNNFSYMMLNLVGEVGEFASKVAKHIRKDDMIIISNRLQVTEHPRFPETIEQMYEDEDELKKECGDIMWQLFGLMSVLGWEADDIAEGNLRKLASRKQRNVIDGSGDNR